MTKTASSIVSTETPKASRWPGIMIFGVFALIGLFAISLAGLFWVLTNSYVSGRAMSPETLEFRQFSYWVNPFTGERIRGISQDGTRQPTGAKRHLNTPAEDKQHWVVINKFQSGKSLEYPASILHDHLDEMGFKWEVKDEDVIFFPDSGEVGAWLDSNSEHGAVFWPLVQKIAQSEHFGAVPAFFIEIEQYYKQDKSTRDKEVFDSRLRRVISDHLVEIASLRIDKDKNKEAIAALDQAIDIDSTNSGAFRLRAKALRKDSRHEEAKKDSEKADSLKK